MIKMWNIQNLSIEELEILWAKKFKEYYQKHQEFKEHAKTLPEPGENFLKSKEFWEHHEMAMEVNRLTGELIKIGELIKKAKKD